MIKKWIKYANINKSEIISAEKKSWVKDEKANRPSHQEGNKA